MLFRSNRWELFGASNRSTTQEMRRVVVRNFVRDILPGIGSGRVVPLVDSVFEFSQLPAARDRMLANMQTGKIILLAP